MELRPFGRGRAEEKMQEEEIDVFDMALLVAMAQDQRC
jgi:hypothetical protein